VLEAMKNQIAILKFDKKYSNLPICPNKPPTKLEINIELQLSRTSLPGFETKYEAYTLTLSPSGSVLI